MNYINPLPQGKGLFVFTDPGGAKAILSFVHLYVSKANTLGLFCDRAHPFFSDFNTIPIQISNTIEVIEKSIQENKPDYILTGTSYTSKLELQTIEIAKQYQIKVISFIDHWTSLRDRFILSEQEFYPNEIWVLDELAYKKAIEEGIPIALLKIVANPYLAYLESYSPAISKKDFIASYQLNPNKPILLFVPEPLSNVGGISKYGYDECTILDLLLKVCKTLDSKNYQLLIKPHPNQKVHLLKKVLETQTGYYPIVEKGDTNTMLYYSDIIIGMFSNILLEAHIMKKEILRIIPSTADPIHHLNIGTVVHSEETTQAYLLNKLNQ